MKWMGVGILILVGIGIVVSMGFLFAPSHVEVKHAPQVTAKPTIAKQERSFQSIFVPYWGVNAGLSSSTYDRYIYFAISPNEKGIDMSDSGYKNIKKFVQDIPSTAQTLLTVSMIDPTVNEKVLSDTNLQKKVISDAIRIAQQNGFSGIVLDLEYSALAFDSVVRNVSDFSTRFATTVKQNKLSFYQTLAGDTLYRDKPYDVAKIGKNADGIFIMAYDFHKAKGNPGPNFPLSKENDDYDFKDMTSDFLKKIPMQKISVVFGLFGYDWTVDKDGNTTKAGESLSLKDIQQEFVDSCVLLQCQTKRDRSSSETETTYTDSSGARHIVWFEDEKSIAAKKAYLTQKGITSTALWAYSYF